MTITKLMSKDEKDHAAVISTLMRAIELANERKSVTAVVILQDSTGGADTLGTPIRDFFSFMGQFTQLEFKLRVGAEQSQDFDGAA